MQADPVAFYQLHMHHRGRVVASVAVASQRISQHRLAQIAIPVRTGHTLVYSLLQVAVQMAVATYLGENHHHPTVLAQSQLCLGCHLCVLHDRLEHHPRRTCLSLYGVLQGCKHRLRKTVSGTECHLIYGIGDRL